MASPTPNPSVQKKRIEKKKQEMRYILLPWCGQGNEDFSFDKSEERRKKEDNRMVDHISFHSMFSFFSTPRLKENSFRGRVRKKKGNLIYSFDAKEYLGFGLRENTGFVDSW